MSDDRRPATLVRAAIETFGANAAAVGFGLINVLILARGLGPEGRGEVAFVIAVWVVLAGVATLGLDEANANFGGTRAERRPSLLTNSILASVVFGLVIAVLGGALMTLVPKVRGGVDLELLLVALATLPSGLLQQYTKYLLQSDYRFGVTNVAWIASPASSAVINGGLLLAGALTVGTVITVFVVTNAFATLILLVSAVRHFGIGRPDIALGRETISFGLKSHLSHFMHFATWRGDQWLLGVIAGPYELGLYSIAVSIAEVLFYVSGVIVLVQRPHLVRALPAQAAEFASRTFRRALVLSAAAGAALFAAAPLVIVVLFGEKFRGSVDDLRLLCCAAFGVVAVDLFSNTIIAQRRPLLASAGTGAALVVTLVLNIVLDSSMGGLGAAISKAAAFSTGGAVMGLMFLKMFKGSGRTLVPRLDDIAWFWRKVQSGLAVVNRRR